MIAFFFYQKVETPGKILSDFNAGAFRKIY